LPVLLLAACGSDPDLNQYGAHPELPAQERGVLPDMTIAKPTEWGDLLPRVHEGFTIKAIATDLAIPRQTLVLPNGDILVAEGRGGSAPKLTPKDVIASYVKSKGTSPVKGGNRVTLLSDRDGDGNYDKSVFAANLNAPYGLALIGDQLYVAIGSSATRSARTSCPTTSPRCAKAASTAGPTATGARTWTCARSRRIRRRWPRRSAPTTAWDRMLPRSVSRSRCRR